MNVCQVLESVEQGTQEKPKVEVVWADERNLKSLKQSLHIQNESGNQGNEQTVENSGSRNSKTGFGVEDFISLIKMITKELKFVKELNLEWDELENDGKLYVIDKAIDEYFSRSSSPRSMTFYQFVNNSYFERTYIQRKSLKYCELFKEHELWF